MLNNLIMLLFFGGLIMAIGASVLASLAALVSNIATFLAAALAVIVFYKLFMSGFNAETDDENAKGQSYRDDEKKPPP